MGNALTWRDFATCVTGLLVCDSRLARYLHHIKHANDDEGSDDG